MPLPYRPPLEEDETFNREGMGKHLRQMAAESNRYYVGKDIAERSPMAIPGLYIGQVLQDVAKLGYFHGPKPLKSLTQKLSALAYGEDDQFNDQTTPHPALDQYRALHEGVKRGANDRVSGGMIDYLAPRIAKFQNADPQQVRDHMLQERDWAVNAYQPSLSEMLQEFVGDSAKRRRAISDAAVLRQAGLTSPKQSTPSGNIWGLTHPVEAQKLLHQQLQLLSPGDTIPDPVKSNLRLSR